MKNSKTIALIFSALGHPLRVDIFKCLLAHYPHSMTAGKLSSSTKIAPSTLSHHLRAMEEGQVIVRSIEGRQTNICLDLKSLRDVAGTLMDVCCSAESVDVSFKK